MKQIDALNKMIQFAQPVLHTKEVATLLDISRANASQLLRRLSQSESIISLKHGLWLIDKTLDPYQLIPYLTAPFPCYLSLQSALYFHGMISQIPEVIYVISIARTHRLRTALGDYSFHHVHPDFFFGFTVSNENNIPMATPEKALIDFLYLSPTSTKHFHALPELSLPESFDHQLAQDMIARIPSPRTKALVSTKFAEIVSLSH